MADPQAVAFVCGTLFGLAVARLLPRSAVNVVVRQTFNSSTDGDVIIPGPDAPDDDESESWKGE